VKTYKTYAKAQARVETLRKRGTWPAIVGTDITGYRLLYEPEDPAAPGPGYARAASKGELAAEARRQSNAALNEAFGRFAGLAWKTCADRSGLAENINAAVLWAQQQDGLDAKSPRYVEVALRRALGDKRYQGPAGDIPKSDEVLTWIRAVQGKLPDGELTGGTEEARAKLEWYREFYTIWLDQFPEIDRECFKQTVMHGRSIREVAADLELPKTTVERKADKVRAEIEAQHRAHEAKLLTSR
jgi:hypothetical protein